MTITEYSTSPPRAQSHRPRTLRRQPIPDPAPRRRPTISAHGVRAGLGAAVAVVLAGYVLGAGWRGDLDIDAVVTLLVFVVAVWMWIFAPVDDTSIALGAALALVVVGAVDTETFTETLGSELIWLMVGAFVIAAAITASGLSARLSARVLTWARTPRHLVHLVTFALLITTFAIPSTSGRAAIALPVFLALAKVLRDRARLVLCLALVFPAVILFSAIGSLLGAGAHLITSQILDTTVGSGIDYLTWAMLGLPLAILWSHLAAEVALWIFTDHAERATPLRITREAVGAITAAPIHGPFSTPQRRLLWILGVVIALWCTESVHGLSPAIVAMLGALVATAPAVGATTMPAAVKTIPWTLLLFMAATIALGVALSETVAAQWLADQAFGSIRDQGPAGAISFVVVVVVISLAAHLVMQSRSARSAVLVPIVVATAPLVGVDPAAAAFISTAAAGFCITLTSSAKPVAMFAASETVPGYDSRHLLSLTAVLAPISLGLLLAFAFWVWPALGLPLLAS
ncbi:SLC13 family permease [Gordonia sp. LSe1-13]|uniref:SLC13 family permease n=1 Tax=Gordonia sesuvii TaxID=3116777 RepID=A0ABU7MIL1_9ACTN|nr:SLC13 family permease [Gordonia sp. LSe1-13]